MQYGSVEDHRAGNDPRQNTSSNNNPSTYGRQGTSTGQNGSLEGINESSHLLGAQQVRSASGDDAAEHSSSLFYKKILPWLVALSSCYTLERCSFKILVDQAGPFRLFTAEAIAGIRTMILVCTVVVCPFIASRRRRGGSGGSSQSDGSGGGATRSGSSGPGSSMIPGSDWKFLWQLPLMDLGLIAFLDAMHIIFSVISASHVPAVLTVILMQLNIPFTVAITQCSHEDGACSCVRTMCCPEEDDEDEDEDDEGQEEEQGYTDQEQGFQGTRPTPAQPARVNGALRDEEGAANNASNQNNVSGNADVASSSPSRRRGATDGSSPSSPGSNAQVPTAPPRSWPLSSCSSLKWGGYTTRHLLGATLIAFSLALCLVPAGTGLEHPSQKQQQFAFSKRTAWNTFVFALSILPSSASTVLKERALYTYRQPVNVDQLNLALSAAQFILVGVMSPLFYPLQGLAASDGDGDFGGAGVLFGWVHSYPSRDVTANFVDGMKCLVGVLSDDVAENGYAEVATCGEGDNDQIDATSVQRMLQLMFPPLLVLLIVHIVSIMVVAYAVERVILLSSSVMLLDDEETSLSSSTKGVYRALSAGLLAAVALMYAYGEHIEIVGKVALGAVPWVLLLPSVVVLLLGLEVYHNGEGGLEGETFETVYPEIDSCNEEE